MKKILLTVTFILTCILSIQAQVLYGTTSNGGDKGGGGTIYEFIPAANNLTVPKSFESIDYNPNYTNFIQVNGGKLYGMTANGGSAGYGVIFSFDPFTGTYSKLKDFDNTNGGNPYGSLIQANDGKLYGMTAGGGNGLYGVIFSFDIATSTYTKLYDFDNVNGANPQGSLMQGSDGKLYGMTYGGGSNGAGVIFSFDPSSSTYINLKDFDNINGANPSGNLIQTIDGKLYGMTYFGGSSGAGVIFSFDPSTAIFTRLEDFDGSTNGGYPIASLTLANDDKLYGVTTFGGSSGSGVIFSFDPSSSNFTKLYDFDNINGANPYGGIIQTKDGKLYGMTTSGGSIGVGVIFSFDPSDSVYTKLKDFDGINGGSPNGNFIQTSDEKLYGMTYGGGSGRVGVIFSFDPSTSYYTKLKDFGTNESGNTVSASLVQAKDGKLYGMTIYGGGIGFGTIFSFDPSSSTYTKVYDFDTTNGSNPWGALIQASDGKLYGLTNAGGSNNSGVIFSFDPSSSTYTKHFDFDGTNGAGPNGSLMQAGDGKLYGVTTYGGNGNAGVIFSFDPSSSSFAKLYDFDWANGGYPYSRLAEAGDGKLYGVTNGGSSNGVIFSFDPASSAYAKLHIFDGIGDSPQGSLTQGSDGRLYGMLYGGGGNGYGLIFSFDPLSSAYAKQYDFDGTNGAGPDGNLIQASDGKLYGTTTGGGANNAGVIFSFDPASATYTNLKDLTSVSTIHIIGSTLVEIQECITSTTYYRDSDGDGYGDPNSSVKACSPPAGYITDNTDCDDTKALVHPGAAEICDNGIDDNCNGQTDENCNGVPVISINDVYVDESQRVAVVTATLSHASSKPVWLLYFTKDGTAVSWGRSKDYKAKIDLLVIRPGSLTATISVKIIKDNIPEPTEYFDVVLLASLNASITDRHGRIFISDEMPIADSKANAKRGVGTTSANSLKIKVTPNPAASRFNLIVESNNKTDKINMRVIDIQGKLIDVRSNLIPGQTLQIGSRYRPGTYFIQAVQGKQRSMVTLIKIPD